MDEDFASAVEISGDYLFIGAEADHEKAPMAGSVHVYKRQEDGTWEHTDKLYGSKPWANSGRATSVSASSVQFRSKMAETQVPATMAQMPVPVIRLTPGAAVVVAGALSKGCRINQREIFNTIFSGGEKDIMVRLWQSPMRKFFQEGWGMAVIMLDIMAGFVIFSALALRQLWTSIGYRILK